MNKGSSFMVSTLVFVAALRCVQAAPQMRDVVTDNDLTQKYQKAVSENPLQKMKNMKVQPIDGPDPTKAVHADLLATSDFLSFGGFATLVPKHAILCIPKNYQDRIKLVPGSKIVSWGEFLNANRGWIKTLEVTRAQAEGVSPFDEKVAENLQKSSIVIVATYQTGPISVLPKKEPVEPPKEVKEPKDGKEAKDGKDTKTPKK
jgi:hypothetical protein